LKKDRYLESIQALLQLLPSYRRFPNDEEFKREFVVRDLYNFPRRSYWLRRIENWDRKERVPVDQYTIEHIMPQNENLSRQWREDLGPEWERIHETKLHTLGNLTLTGYNSEYSDRPFIEKRDMEGGFKESPLRLNEGLGLMEAWDSAAIQHRANRLAGVGVKVWAAPNLSTDVLDTYRPTTEKASSYSIDDHAHLALGTTTRSLFEALRKELLALDPCVTEEFLKLYIAYKAETNFVDVVPQASRLRLALNMQFHELHDPRGIAKDVTNLGRWGNGDVEVGLTSIEDLPYALGLIRQSFEKQMGNGESGE
jgi:predicted transport protein